MTAILIRTMGVRMQKAFGVLVISHGSKDTAWVKLVDETVNQMVAGRTMPVITCFLELVQGRLIQDGIDALERLGVTDIIAIPLFVSSGSTHVQEIGWALGDYPDPGMEVDLLPFRLGSRLHYLKSMDDEEEIVAIIQEKTAVLSECPEEERVLLIAHGSSLPVFHERWRVMLERFAMKLKDLDGYLAVDYATLLPDQVRRKLDRWALQAGGSRILVAPLFLSEGYFTRKVIPSRLEGYTYTYSGQALLPHRNITRWLDRQVRRFLDKVGLD